MHTTGQPVHLPSSKAEHGCRILDLQLAALDTLQRATPRKFTLAHRYHRYTGDPPGRSRDISI